VSTQTGTGTGGTLLMRLDDPGRPIGSWRTMARVNFPRCYNLTEDHSQMSELAAKTPDEC
jgi:hypothetical protein